MALHSSDAFRCNRLLLFPSHLLPHWPFVPQVLEEGISPGSHLFSKCPCYQHNPCSLTPCPPLPPSTHSRTHPHVRSPVPATLCAHATPPSLQAPPHSPFCRLFLLHPIPTWKHTYQGLGLEENPDKPLVAVITRLVPQKGIHLIKAALFRSGFRAYNMHPR